MKGVWRDEQEHCHSPLLHYTVLSYMGSVLRWAVTFCLVCLSVVQISISLTYENWCYMWCDYFVVLKDSAGSRQHSGGRQQLGGIKEEGVIPVYWQGFVISAGWHSVEEVVLGQRRLWLLFSPVESNFFQTAYQQHHNSIPLYLFQQNSHEGDKVMKGKVLQLVQIILWW